LDSAAENILPSIRVTANLSVSSPLYNECNIHLYSNRILHLNNNELAQPKCYAYTGKTSYFDEQLLNSTSSLAIYLTVLQKMSKVWQKCLLF